MNTIVADTNNIADLFKKVLTSETECATFQYPPNAEELFISVDQYSNSKELEHVSLSLDFVEQERLFPIEELNKLYAHFGGQNHLAIALYDKDNREFGPNTLFDVCIANFKRGMIMLNNPERLYSQREILKPLFNVFRIDAIVNEDAKQMNIPYDQSKLVVTQDGILQAYQLMISTGHFPSIGNGSDTRLFCFIQHQSENGKMYHGLNVQLGGRRLDTLFDPVSDTDLNLLDQTLVRNGFMLAGKTLRYTTGVSDAVKQLRKVIQGL